MDALPTDIVEALARLGVDPALLTCSDDGPRVIVVQAGLETARRALKENNRDQVVMARVDQATAAELDRWVAAGVAKSRSEAAALFLGEGLRLRAADLARLSAALGDFEAAKARLQQEARTVFGHDAPEDGTAD